MISRLHIRQLAVTFGFVLAAVVGIFGIVSVLTLSQFEADFDALLTQQLPHDQILRDIRGQGIALFSSANELVIDSVTGAEADEAAGERTQLQDTMAALETSLAQLNSLPLAADSNGERETVTEQTQALIAGVANILPVLDAGQIEEAADLRETLEVFEINFRAAIDGILSEESLDLANQQALTKNALESAETAIAAAAILVPLLIVTALFAVGNVEQHFLSSMLQQSDRIRAGEYAARVKLAVDRVPLEYSALTASLNELAEAIQQRETDLKQLNETLERRVRDRTREADAARRIAEENNRLKSEFLATMSHELRTPLNAIEGFTSIIRNRMGGVEYNTKAERYIERIEANSKRLLGLINDFLDISRIESGRLQLAHSPFSPAETAQRWADEIGVLAEKKGIGFELNFDPALPTTVMGDEESLSKVAINLLGNAIKFTEEGKVTLNVRAAGDNWQIEVKDTGIGIPPHAREYIFDEFRQVDQTSRRKYGGTGLGLAIVQKMVRVMGGSVVVDSEVGHGSTFTVTVPLMLPENSTIPA